jgi:hypothetical protein
VARRRVRDAHHPGPVAAVAAGGADAGAVPGIGEAGGHRYRATATVVQSDFGIKPYAAFLGALRVRDAVDVEVELDLAEPETPPPKQP